MPPRRLHAKYQLIIISRITPPSIVIDLNRFLIRDLGFTMSNIGINSVEVSRELL